MSIWILSGYVCRGFRLWFNTGEDTQTRIFQYTGSILQQKEDLAATLFWIIQILLSHARQVPTLWVVVAENSNHQVWYEDTFHCCMENLVRLLKYLSGLPISTTSEVQWWMPCVGVAGTVSCWDGFFHRRTWCCLIVCRSAWWRICQRVNIGECAQTRIFCYTIFILHQKEDLAATLFWIKQILFSHVWQDPTLWVFITDNDSQVL